MHNFYIISQGPGKALKLLTKLDELVDGDNIASESQPSTGQTNKGRAASLELDRLVKGMEKEEVLALLGSVVSLCSIADGMKNGLSEYVKRQLGSEFAE